MNHTTATIDECRDYIAKCKGWTLGTDPKWIGTSGFIVWQRDGVQHPSLGHPIPATLDAAHGSLPEGYRWMVIDFNSDRHEEFIVDAWATGPDQNASGKASYGAERDACLCAMFRASAAAWAQVKGEQA